MKRVFLGVLLGAAASIGAAGADTTQGGGSGGIPTPFDTANQRVELADSEKYELIGKIVSGPKLGRIIGEVADPVGTREIVDMPQTYLEVDLTAHPWLANAQRAQRPFYPIETGSWETWSPYQYKRVKMVCRAHGLIVAEDHKAKYVIGLTPVPDMPIEVLPASPPTVDDRPRPR